MADFKPEMNVSTKFIEKHCVKTRFLFQQGFCSSCNKWLQLNAA